MIIAETILGEKMHIGELPTPFEQSLICPCCKEPVAIKRGKIRQAHFAHYPNSHCDSFSEGETQEHLLSKEFLQKWSRTGVLEAYLPDLQQRPDLLIDFLAVEVQCSTLTLERMEERTLNYQRHRYFPWWIVGDNLVPKNRWSQLQKAFTYYDQGKGIHLWHIHNHQEIWLMYAIRQHYQLGVIFHVKKWRSTKDSLTNLLGFQMEEKPLFAWEWEAYRFSIRKKFFRKESKILLIQEHLYPMGGNIQSLPSWCYQASEFYFYFGDWLLFLRFAVLKTDSFKGWLQYLKQGAFVWSYPLVSQKNILLAVYQEAVELKNKQNL